MQRLDNLWRFHSRVIAISVDKRIAIGGQWLTRHNRATTKQSSIFARIFSPTRNPESSSLDRARVICLLSMDVDFFCNSALCSTVEILKGRGRQIPKGSVEYPSFIKKKKSHSLESTLLRCNRDGN